jgi:signal transduction histidine kinase
MLKPTKFILGSILLVISFLRVSALQDGDPDIEWYQSFFQEQDQKPVDELLQTGAKDLEEARETRDALREAHLVMEMGLVHLTRTKDYEKAMDFFIRALTIQDSLAVKDKKVFTYLAIAHVFEEVGDYDNSAKSLDQAMQLNEKTKNLDVLVLILNQQGKINAATGKIDAAFENYGQVLEHKDEVNNPKAEAEAFFNLAQLHVQQGKYPEALEQHKLALALRRSIDDRPNEARSLNAIGELYKIMKNDERALANHVAAIKIRKRLDDKQGIAESYNNIGILYYHQKNISQAIANLKLALQAAQEAQAQNQISRSYDFLSQCYNELGDYKNALEYKNLSLAMNDLILSDKNEHRLLETQNRYVIGKKELQIDKLQEDTQQKELQLAEQQKFRNILFLIIGLILIIVLLVLYLYILKQRSNKILKLANDKVHQQNLELQELNATKDKFFSIISHDLKGPLNSLTSFSGLLINHTESLSKEEIQMLAKDLDKSIKNLFALLENLLEWSRSQTGNIEFKPESFDLAIVLDENQALLNAQAQHKRIKIINEHTGEILVNAHKNSVNTVLRNLISNAIKFTPEGGAITLKSIKGKGVVIISITDTGVGMSAEVIRKLFRIDTKHSTKGTANEKGTGLGLILCKDFVEKNGGQILVESEVGKGSVFSFSLPLAP